MNARTISQVDSELKAAWVVVHKAEMGTDLAAWEMAEANKSRLLSEWAALSAAQGPSPREMRRIAAENRGWRD